MAQLVETPAPGPASGSPAKSTAQQPRLECGAPAARRSDGSPPTAGQGKTSAHVWHTRTEMVHSASDPQAESREAVFLRAQNSIMLQEIERLKHENVP